MCFFGFDLFRSDLNLSRLKVQRNVWNDILFDAIYIVEFQYVLNRYWNSFTDNSIRFFVNVLQMIL